MKWIEQAASQQKKFEDGHRARRAPSDLRGAHAELWDRIVEGIERFEKAYNAQLGRPAVRSGGDSITRDGAQRVVRVSYSTRSERESWATIKLTEATGDVEVRYEWKDGGGGKSDAWHGSLADAEDGTGMFGFVRDTSFYTDVDAIVEALLRPWTEGFQGMEAGDR